MSAQDRTLDQYHELMQVNAVSHIIRSGRELGIFAELGGGQRTIEQLCESLALEPGPAALLLDALSAVGVVQKYGEDLALSPAAQLLCQYDSDLGDRRWIRLSDQVRQSPEGEAEVSDQQHFDSIAATQWIHTPAAMQAAEILDIGGEDELSGPAILDLGCGSAVWSCAMAHRDSQATVTAVDTPAALAAATSTAESIEIGDRFRTVPGDPDEVQLPESGFDLVLLPQRLHALDDRGAERLVARAVAATAPGGRIVVIDLFRGPTKPKLAESVEALRLELDTRAGRMRSLEETQTLLARAGLENIQFSFLAASRINLGMMVGIKPLSGSS